MSPPTPASTSLDWSTFVQTVGTPEIRGYPILSWRIAGLLDRGAPVVETGRSGSSGAKGTLVRPSLVEGLDAVRVYWETGMPTVVTSLTHGTALDVDDDRAEAIVRAWLGCRAVSPLPAPWPPIPPSAYRQALFWAPLVAHALGRPAATTRLLRWERVVDPRWMRGTVRCVYGQVLADSPLMEFDRAIVDGRGWRLQARSGLLRASGPETQEAGKACLFEAIRRTGVGVYDPFVDLYLPPILQEPYGTT